MHDFRAHFDLDPALTYLNSGTQSIAPRRVAEAVTRHARAYERNPTAELIAVWGKLWNVQRELGDFLGARAEDLFLRANVTAAMNALILGMPLEAGSEILIGDTEYGAVHHIARFRSEQGGHPLRVFHIPTRASEVAAFSETALVDLVVGALSPRTRMVILSQVMTGSGLQIPIAPISRELRKRDVLFVVDGAHATGALDMNFADLAELDFYAGNLHKWLMGPKGTGFAWVHPRHQDALVPRHAGWTTYDVRAPHESFAPGHPFAQRHLEASCIDFAPFLACAEAFAFWRELGAERIRGRQASLRDCARTEMHARLGWDCLTPEAPELSGPLLSFEMPEQLQSMGFGLLTELLSHHQVQVGVTQLQGRWILRLSPQIYNSEVEIQRAVRAIAELAGA